MSALSIFAPRRFGRLLASDALNASRDPMLVFATVMSVLPWLGIWYFRDMIDDAVAESFGVGGFSDYLTPFAVLIPAMLIGWVTGFLLLEDRDEGTLLAIDVTPVGKAGFLAYRAVATVVLVAAIAFPATLTLMPTLGVWLALLVALLAGVEGVAAAAVLPAVARNKVEGLALTKVTNIAALLPLIAIVPSGWRYLAGVLPPFWIGEIALLSGERILSVPVVVLLAVLSHLALGAGLFWLLGRRRG